MDTFRIYFRPRSSLASPITSETLFGAICWGIQILGLKENVATWLLDIEHPPFIFSNPFPVWYINNRANSYLYPRPATLILKPQDFQEVITTISMGNDRSSKETRLKLADWSKWLKQATYITEAVLSRICSGNLTMKEILLDLVSNTGLYHFTGQVIMLGSERKDLEKQGVFLGQGLYQEIPVQHNSVDRLAGATVQGMLFYENEFNFASQAGLWAYARTEASIFHELVIPALKFLEDTGFGANRSSGKGQFSIFWEPVQELPDEKEPNAWMTLSRYIPSREDHLDFNNSPLAYRLTTIRARREQKYPTSFPEISSSPVYKQAVRAFEPGSVFPLNNLNYRREYYGRIVQVVSQNDGGPIFQSEAAVPIFIRVPEDSNDR